LKACSVKYSTVSDSTVSDSTESYLETPALLAPALRRALAPLLSFPVFPEEPTADSSIPNTLSPTFRQSWATLKLAKYSAAVSRYQTVATCRRTSSVNEASTIAEIETLRWLIVETS
jgi:hypothetical protein